MTITVTPMADRIYRFVKEIMPHDVEINKIIKRRTDEWYDKGGKR